MTHLNKKSAPKRRLTYSPPITLAAHYANKTFREDHNRYQADVSVAVDAVKKGAGGEALDQLTGDFRARYPHYSEFSPTQMSPSVMVIPNYNPCDDPLFMKRFGETIRRLSAKVPRKKSKDAEKAKGPDATLHLFPESLPVHTLDGSECPFNLHLESGSPEPKFHDVPVSYPVSEGLPPQDRPVGQFLRLQIDLNQEWEELKRELEAIVNAYRNEYRSKIGSAGRRREDDLLESLKLEECRILAEMQGVAPQTLLDPAKFPKKPPTRSQRYNEWRNLDKKFSRAKTRARQIFRELGLPLS